jgi:hypothetical protein
MQDAKTKALEIVKARRSLYVEKQKRHEGSFDIVCTESERIEHTIEALDWLYSELQSSLL